MPLDAARCRTRVPVPTSQLALERAPYSAIFDRIRPYSLSPPLSHSRGAPNTLHSTAFPPRGWRIPRRLLPLLDDLSRDYPRLPEITRDCPRLGSCLLFDFVITSRFVGGVGLVILSIFIYGSKVGQLAVRLSETVRDCPRWPGRLSRDRPERLSRGVTSPPGGAADRVACRCRCPPAA